MSPVYIYELYDPRDDSVHYIGKTNNPQRRLQQHIQGAVTYTSNTDKDQWIRGLAAVGVTPRMRLVERVDTGDGLAQERARIHAYRRHRQPIKNMTHYHPPLTGGDIVFRFVGGVTRLVVAVIGIGIGLEAVRIVAHLCHH